MTGAEAAKVANQKMDGRAARAERTRAAITDSMLALIEDGDLRPTAGRIAERAGISERIIYHHFSDLEALLGAVADRQIERVMARVTAIDPTLPLDDRIDALVAQRAEIMEWITPVRRASILQEPFSPELRRHLARVTETGRTMLAATFADEVGALPAGERRELLAALDAAAGWSTWDALRTGGLSVPAARRAMRRLVAGLLG